VKKPPKNFTRRLRRPNECCPRKRLVWGTRQGRRAAAHTRRPRCLKSTHLCWSSLRFRSKRSQMHARLQSEADDRPPYGQGADFGLHSAKGVEAFFFYRAFSDLAVLGVGQDCKNPKGGHDEYHRNNCRRESVCIDHGHDFAAGGQRNKLANGLAAFGLTRVRIRKPALAPAIPDIAALALSKRQACTLCTRMSAFRISR
jgi:hypothetical protein